MLPGQRLRCTAGPSRAHRLREKFKPAFLPPVGTRMSGTTWDSVAALAFNLGTRLWQVRASQRTEPRGTKHRTCKRIGSHTDSRLAWQCPSAI